MKQKRKFKIRYLLILLLIFIITTVIIDFIRISSYEIHSKQPDPNIVCEQNEIYLDLVNEAPEIEWDRITGTLEYIRKEYDCSDFRLVNLVRILYDFENEIPENYLKQIEEVLFNFRYWWDEPGENSMCYWSENHQILFASAEYLIGQKYPDATFPNSGLTGRKHMEKARVRALDWLKMRWDHGFIEYYSSVYYKEDIAALINLIDYAGDKEIVIKSQIIMDLLFYDVASQSIGTMFITASGRAYKGNRTGSGSSDLGGLTRFYWGDGKEIGPGMMYGMMRTKKYTLPPVLKEIAKDSSGVIIKQSNGLDLSELKAEGYYGTDNRSMMMQWGMEAFTNPEVVRNSMAHIRSSNMFSNAFLGDFKLLDYKLLHWLHLEPAVMRIINPQTNGVAIQKGNTYTYKTGDYSMYTVQDHQPGDYGDQQHVFGMNIYNHFSIFHNHPALEKNVDGQSPSYWVGYGHFPHSAQERNVNMSIYNIPEKKGMMEADLLDYTRAYFPRAEFDTAFMSGKYLFGKKENTYCGLIGATDFEFRDEARDDVIQAGKQSFWITEAGSTSEDGSFEEFTRRIGNNQVSFDPESLTLKYESNRTSYELVFGKDFKVDGQVIDSNYKRYDSPYAKAEKKDETITYKFNGESLFLDFEKMIRIY
ncbi:MAG TPA: hypothetical protein ENI20_20240 [Bacteroides sp.]|nr:hypothetical protein [Bacteroides sp.]